MRAVLVVVIAGLGGCNAVFGLSRTKPAPEIDAQYFDAPADAPYMCAAMSAPVFSPYLQQVYEQPECHDFNAARDGFAVARCARPAQVEQGSLVAIPELSNSGVIYGPPRITPEGDAMLITDGSNIEVFAHSGTSWTAAGSLVLPYSLSTTATIGVPTDGPQRRIMLVNTDGMIRELAIDTNGTASELHAFTPQELGGGNIVRIDTAPSLTPDGLHVVFVGFDGSTSDVYYGSRSSVTSAFTPASAIAAAGNVTDPFLTSDCGRLYFSVVGSVVYVEQ